MNNGIKAVFGHYGEVGFPERLRSCIRVPSWQAHPWKIVLAKVTENGIDHIEKMLTFHSKRPAVKATFRS
eukprot:4348083-Amphidinium_carterae.1